jgi:pyochelin biosynthetic protein PchC
MADDDWIRRFNPAPGARAQLVCLPHAGGSASYFVAMSKALSPKVDVLAVQYPGRQDRRLQPCLESVGEMADQLIDVVRSRADRPITLFGHSMGASVGYELAVRMEAAGIVPTALFVSGRRAPSRHRNERAHTLPDAQLVAEVKALAGAGSALLDDVEIQQLVLPSIRSDYRAAETYTWTPGPMLTCPIFSFTGADDPKVALDEARAWSEHTSGKFEFRVFPGGHFYLDGHTPEVAAAIEAHLADVTP